MKDALPATKGYSVEAKQRDIQRKIKAGSIDKSDHRLERLQIQFKELYETGNAERCKSILGSMLYYKFEE